MSGACARLPISVRDLLERQVLELFVGHEPFQLVVLIAQASEFFGFVDIHCPVTVAPVVERRR